MGAVPFFDTDFRYRIVDPRGEIIQIENDDFKIRMAVDRFERGAALAAEVIAKDRLERLDRGEVVVFPKGPRRA